MVSLAFYRTEWYGSQQLSISDAIAPRWVATTVDLRANDQPWVDYCVGLSKVDSGLRIAKKFAIKSIEPVAALFP